MKNILFIKLQFIWKHTTFFEWDGWRLKVCALTKTTVFAIITTQNNANSVANQSILSVGCLIQIKVFMPFFRKYWFSGQKTSSNTQTSPAKVKCFSLASKSCLHLLKWLQAVPSHGVYSWYEITFPSISLFAVQPFMGSHIAKHSADINLNLHTLLSALLH